MNLVVDRPKRPANPSRHALTPDPALRWLGRVLLGKQSDSFRLPPLSDLLDATTTLAAATRSKMLIPLSDVPHELALVREEDELFVSYYETIGAMNVHVLNRSVPLKLVLEGIERVARHIASASSDAAIADHHVRVADRAKAVRIEEVSVRTNVLQRSGGIVDNPGEDTPLVFGFTTGVRPTVVPHSETSYRSDAHALLFDGTLWAFVRGRRVLLARGPIMLAAHRMLAAVRFLVEAWDSGRPAHVRLRAQEFQVGVRLGKTGEVALSLGKDRDSSVTVTALDVLTASLPILKLTSELLRVLVSVDRAQLRNLRVRSLREEVRELRRKIRQRYSQHAFTNPDPDRVRLQVLPSPATGEEIAEAPKPRAQALQFMEQWRAEVDGLEASSTFLCGDRLVVSTLRGTVALSRDKGDVLWTRPVGGATALMAGTTLFLLSPDGHVELCDVRDGDSYARARVAPRIGSISSALVAGGGSVPPVVIFAEGEKSLVSLDLRTGQLCWRFESRGAGAFRLRRAGRILIVVSGDMTLHALDIVTGEVIWKFSDTTRFMLAPSLCGDFVVAASGAPRCGPSNLYAIDLCSGELRWKKALNAGPCVAPMVTGSTMVLAVGDPRRSHLVAYDSSGAPLWKRKDPGLARGGESLHVDDMILINAPGGEVAALDLGNGKVRWAQRFAHPTEDEVPRRLEPILRGGALFVPSASVCIVRPTDGSLLGPQLPCDLVPDWMRVDERGWVYVAEESGHIAAYRPRPQLSLIKGGA